MTIERITIEWRPIEATFADNDLLPIIPDAGHLYIVARETGEVGGDGVTISIGPSYPQSTLAGVLVGDYGYIQINGGNGAGSPLGSTANPLTIDYYQAGDTEDSRGSRDISDELLAAGGGQTLDQIWAIMTQLANEINAEQFIYDPSYGLAPDGVGRNSNSTIASVLSKVGVSVDDVLPYEPGTQNLATNLFPGSDTLLSGAGNDYLRGWDGNDLFQDSGGGNDIFHGGDGENLVRSDSSDGFDSVYYDSGSSVSINTASDLSSWNAVETVNGVEYTDTLHSIEEFGSRTFLIENRVDFGNNDQGINLQDSDEADLLSDRQIFGAGVETSVKVSFGSDTVSFSNFGTFTGTSYADIFTLNALLGRRFEGGAENGPDVGTSLTSSYGSFSAASSTSAGDKISYAGFNDPRGLTIDAGLGTVLITGTDQVAGPGAPVFDSFTGMEIIEGSSANDIFRGSDGSDTLFGGSGFDEFYMSTGNDIIDGGNDGGGNGFSDRLRLTGFDGVMHFDGSNYHDDSGTWQGEFSGILEVLLESGTSIVTTNGGSGIEFRGAAATIDHVVVTESILAGDFGKTLNGDGILSESGMIVGGGGIRLAMAFGSSPGSGAYTGDGDVMIMESNGMVYDFAAYQNNAWLNFSSFATGVAFGSGSGVGKTLFRNEVIANPGGLNIVGSDHGDIVGSNSTFFAGSVDNLGTFWSGNGDDFVNILSGTYIYQGGNDTIYTLRDVTLAPVITSSMISYDTEVTSSGFGAQFATFHYNIVVTVAGHGEVTFANLTRNVYYGNDGQYGTADDVVTMSDSVTVNLWDGRFYDIGFNGGSLLGSAINSTSVPTPFDDVINGPVAGGGSGDDVINAGSGNDTVYGGFGDEILHGGVGNDHLFGGFGDDQVYGDSGDDALEGGVGNDQLFGGIGNDTLIGGEGNDILNDTDGMNNLSGGSGDDVYVVSGGGSTIVDDSGVSDVTISGRSTQDTLFTVDQGGSINFSDRTTNSTIMTVGGASFSAIDSLIRFSDSALNSFSLSYTVSESADVVSIFGASLGGLVNLYGGSDVFEGSFHGDVVYGGTGDDRIFSLDGDDVLVGGAGNDSLSGGAGNDTYIFSPGDGFDFITDYEGNNTLVINGGIQPYALSYDRLGDNLLINIASGVYIGGFYTGQTNFNVTFDDGSVFSLDDLVENAASNAPPSAAADAFSSPQDMEIEGNLLANNGFGADSDLDGDSLSVVSEIKASVQGGSVIILGNGDFTYMPPAGYTGADSFEYTLTDGRGGFDTGAVSLDLTPVVVNHDPVAEDDSFSTMLMQSLSGNVLDNDTDPDGNPLTVQQAAIMTAAGGLVTLMEDGSFTYTPMSGFIGADSFDYTVFDGQGGFSTGTVNIAVTASACTIIGTGLGEKLKGDHDSDTILAMGGNDTVKGKKGADTLLGGMGDDKLYGDDGNDLLIGGSGKDLLDGGKGNDILIGGDVYMDRPLFSDENVLFPTLKETKNIQNLTPPGSSALGMVDGELSSDAPREATITFVDTGAGYNNSLGVYNIAADGTFLNVSLAFENVKSVRAGDAVDIMLPGAPDSDFGFFIIADGARQNQNFTNLDLDNGTLNFWFDYGQSGQRQATVFDDGDRVSLVFNDGTQDTVLKGNVYHTTDRGAGVDINADEANHVVSGFVDDCDTSTLRIGFEDLRNLGDADYNDVVFDLSYKPVFMTANTPDGVDTLKGGDGNDLLIGGAGNDILYGGKGSDTFKYLDGDNGMDAIKDFKASEGDRIDISDVLIDDFDPVADMISQFVQITKQGKDSVLSVDADGAANGENFVALAVIEGGKSLDLDMMVQQGNILI